MTIRRKRLPISALEQIDDLCAEFERRWQSNQPQTIESALPAELPEDQRQLLLSELLVLEIDYRRRKGESPEAQEYMGRFPEHAQTIRDALGLEPGRGRPFRPPSIAHVARLFPSLQIISLLGAGGMGAVTKPDRRGSIGLWHSRFFRRSSVTM